jgi:hypothetical protein
VGVVAQGRHETIDVLSCAETWYVFGLFVLFRSKIRPFVVSSVYLEVRVEHCLTQTNQNKTAHNCIRPTHRASSQLARDVCSRSTVKSIHSKSNTPILYIVRWHAIVQRLRRVARRRKCCCLRNRPRRRTRCLQLRRYVVVCLVLARV